MNATQTTHQVVAGQQALINGVDAFQSLFTFGSVEAYTAEKNASLIKWNSAIPTTPIEEALATAQKRGHEIAWAIKESCVIVDTKTYPGYYAERAAKLGAALRLSVGDLVELEGRVYRLAKANNQNVDLIPVAA